MKMLPRLIAFMVVWIIGAVVCRYAFGADAWTYNVAAFFGAMSSLADDVVRNFQEL